MEGVLRVVGERGFRAASVREVLEYSGAHRRQFYDHFDNLEDCFAQATEAWIERLGVDLLEAAIAVDGWRASVQAGLVRLFDFVSAEPTISRALLVEVQIAGGAALAQHDMAVDRLAGAIDAVREDMPAEQEPPAATGLFVVAGIEACVCDVLSAGEAGRVWGTLPELMHMAAGSYFGRDEADEAFEAARAFLDERSAAKGGKA
jgi:AcrR family transcriptional regulator